ncbi:hypothetical protein DdX_17789 [Ditylenchus destructor]|uniref:Uncharacterized protein n=1 Tax=Ditylenchus destructor TaxID=166010 RepID=A0AAD4MKR8_9BILA|nr:hypothetical protein DdX_17789 [Ditylenchus destructor]
MGFGRFRCCKSTCKNKPGGDVSAGKGTWFEDVNLSVFKIIGICYGFTKQWSYDDCIEEAQLDGENDERSSRSVALWYL